MNYQELRREVTKYYIEQGHKSLTDACEKAKVNYTTIYNQLYGRSEIKLYSMKEFVEEINEKFTINKDFKIVRR